MTVPHLLLGLATAVVAPSLFSVGAAYHVAGAIDAQIHKREGEQAISCSPTTVCGNILYGFEYALGFYVGTALMNKLFGPNQ